MKLLLAIISCHRFSPRVQAQRATWCQNLPAGLDLRVFVGKEAKCCAHAEDEICLPVPDTYEGLPEKVKAMCAWAEEREYDYVHKIDDDVYLRPERLVQSVPLGLSYVGRKRGPSCPCHRYPETCEKYPADYCSGFSYWIDRRSVRTLIQAPLDPIETAEDRWVGNTLFRYGIEATHDAKYAVIPERPLISPKNDIVSSAEYRDLAEMLIADRHYHGLVQGHIPPHSCLRRFALNAA